MFLYQYVREMNMNVTSPRVLTTAIVSSIVGFADVFTFYIGLGIDNLGLRATSPLIKLIRRGLFPPSLVAAPLLLILGTVLSIMLLRKMKGTSKEERRKPLVGAVVGTLGLAHLAILYWFANVSSAFL